MTQDLTLYQDYLRDESGLVGRAEGFLFPQSREELAATLRAAAERGEGVTLQGARTGLCGGAVPGGGRVVNLSRMCGVRALRYDQARREALLTVEPGVTLEELKKMVGAKSFDTIGWDGGSLDALERWSRDPAPYFFPPNPTEERATVGGVVANGAPGSHLYGYGPVLRWVREAEAVLPDGSVLVADALGGCQRDGEAFSLPLSPGEGEAPGLAGFGLTEAAGMLGVLCGSEGRVAALSALTLRLVPRSDQVWGMLLFFDSAGEAAAFAGLLERSAVGWTGAGMTVLDYLGMDGIRLVESLKPTVTSFRSIPEMRGDFAAALFVEIAAEGEEAAMAAMEDTLLLLEDHSAHAASALAATSAGELEKLRGIRHAVTEAANLTDNRLRPERPRLLLDALLPRERWGEWADRIAGEAGGIASVLFGHLGNGHLHVRLLPEVGEEDRAAVLLQGWVDRLAAVGAACGGEFGIGRIKAPLFAKLNPQREEEMRRICALLDPGGVLRVEAVP